MRGSHGVVGISPFNSYFTVDRIRWLAEWANATFDCFHLFVPDDAASYTLEALGYEPMKARRKARRQANYLNNKIRRALQGVPGLSYDTVIVNNARLDGMAAYQALRNRAFATFQHHRRFRQAVLDCAQWVLQGQRPGGPLSPHADRLASRYLLEELPVFAYSGYLFGHDASVFCYHRCNAFLVDLFSNRFPVDVPPGQGFVVLPELRVGADDLYALTRSGRAAG